MHLGIQSTVYRVFQGFRLNPGKREGDYFELLLIFEAVGVVVEIVLSLKQTTTAKLSFSLIRTVETSLKKGHRKLVCFDICAKSV